VVVVFVDVSFSENESESVSVRVDGGGDGGTWQASARVRHVVGKVLKLAGLPESSKRCLKLLVRSGVSVEGCRDRVGSSGIKNLVGVKKKVEGCLIGRPTLK
jgi:hypothetical protein